MDSEDSMPPLAGKTGIVILNWNSREMTAECIRSLLAMDTVDYRIIVVDNGSRDGSADYLARMFPHITVLSQETNLGFAAGCNVGMKEALDQGADYVLPLNNDTVVAPNFLKELVSVAIRCPRSAAITPKIYFWDAPDVLWWTGGSFSLWSGIPVMVGRKERDVGQFDAERTVDWATGCAALMRREVLREVGLFDECLFGNGEDLDLSLRIRNAGYEVRFAPMAKLWHKEGVDYRKNVGEQMRKFTGTRNMLYIMYKYASPLQWICFAPNFLFRHIFFYIALSIVRADFRSAWAVVRGLAAFPGMVFGKRTSET
jgi:GT2 family glycosyltransferase